MATYSFLNTVAVIAGPGGIIQVGAGASVAEEGITIEPVEDKNQMTIGADGQGQHSLIASDAATVTIRLLKTAPANAALMAMYDFQSASSGLWGSNVITVGDTARKDAHVIQKCAYKKKPTITQAKVGDLLEWTFEGVSATSILGLS